MFESKTKEALKGLDENHPEESESPLGFSIDIIGIGRVDFLINNYLHLIFIWNII